MVQLVVAKDKFNETANAVSSRSRGGNKTLLKPKETDGAGAGKLPQHGVYNYPDGTLPEWAKNLPEYITVATWDIE